MLMCHDLISLIGKMNVLGQKPYWHQAAYYSVVAPGVHIQGVGRTEPELPTIAVFAKDAVCICF